MEACRNRQSEVSFRAGKESQEKLPCLTKLAQGCRVACHSRTLLGRLLPDQHDWEIFMGKPKMRPSCLCNFFHSKGKGLLGGWRMYHWDSHISPRCGCEQFLAVLEARCFGLQKPLKNSTSCLLTGLSVCRVLKASCVPDARLGVQWGAGRHRPCPGGLPIFLERRKQATPT